jgi:hypothetical protein
MEPEITEGIKKATWYNYSATQLELFPVVHEWMLSHPDFFITDILFSSDEGTWITIYFQDRERKEL